MTLLILTLNRLRPSIVNFLREAAVKANSSIIKAEEISDISNATILDYETTKFLENKLKKTLKEIRSLD
ncbi:259_t:CDS:2 [Funneliformis geosporum]|nr:259_t:CDS:2 [Funneliformis geosporum]